MQQTVLRNEALGSAECVGMILQSRLAGRPFVTPLEIIRRAQAGTLIDEDGHVVTLESLPGLSRTELKDFVGRMPCHIPLEIMELLGACRGFYGTVDQVDFTGRDLMFEVEAAFPYGLPIAADGYGNFWVVDLVVADEDRMEPEDVTFLGRAGTRSRVAFLLALGEVHAPDVEGVSDQLLIGS